MTSPITCAHHVGQELEHHSAGAAAPAHPRPSKRVADRRGPSSHTTIPGRGTGVADKALEHALRAADEAR